MMRWIPLLLGFWSAGGSCALILLINRHGRSSRKAPPRKKPSAATPIPFHRDMQEKEYLPLIPRAELRAIKSFLASVVKARGWPHLSSPPYEISQMIEAAWDKVEQEAREPHGGGWVDSFSPTDLKASSLLLLARAIDRVFLGGVQMGDGGALSDLSLAVEEEDASGAYDWISHFDDHNCIHLLRSKWTQEVSEERPMVCEGAICTSRLQVLLRSVTIGQLPRTLRITFINSF